KIKSKLDGHDQQFVQIDKRFDKLENILEEQDIKLFNINKTLKKHSDQFDEMNYTIEKIHNQAVRLSLDQSELDMKIDQFKNLITEQKEKNVNNI
ncbi:MAG: hypothetical protein ACLFQ4_08150, partial [Halanaerobium sp.]